MKVEIKPEETGGEIFIPPSKSVSHRAIIAAALANGTSRIDHVLLSQDIKATLEAIKIFGADIVAEQEAEEGLFKLYITGNPNPEVRDVLIDCFESGSTLRFILPILAIDASNVVVTGKEGLSNRPIETYTEIFDKQEFDYEKGEKSLPIILNGQLEPGIFKIRGDISSQYLTGLFFALPLLPESSDIYLTTPLESKPYVTLTIEVLEEFGIEIEQISQDHFHIPGNQNYRPTSISIRGDFSQAAFWFVNGLINKETTLLNLPETSIQGDFKIIEILNSIGADITYNQDRGCWISKPAKTSSFELNVSDTPDLVPILAIVAALSEGYSRLNGTKRLRFKESDRVLAIANMLESYGVDVSVKENQIIIKGQTCFQGASINSFNDHRIAITAAIASGRAQDLVTILDAQCVNKSYPNFWEEFKQAGGDICELDLG